MYMYVENAYIQCKYIIIFDIIREKKTAHIYLQNSSSLVINLAQYLHALDNHIDQILYLTLPCWQIPLPPHSGHAV